VDDRDHTVSFTDDTVDYVSLIAAAVCPHPPLLVPELAAGAAAELAGLRAACDAAVRRLGHARADRLITVGSARETFTADDVHYGSFAPYGIRDEFPDLPLSLAIGGWLLRRCGFDNWPVKGQAVATGTSATECAALGSELARTAERVALLVMGDGSACRGIKAPGYDDPRAEAYDKGVAAALATADVDALLGLDEQLSAQLMVAGREAWQVLAGAADERWLEAAPTGCAAPGRRWTADLSYEDAPYGVAYFVANWELA
jgi:hypothetical protein